MANVKITDLTEDSAPAASDVAETVQDPGGTPASRKVTLDNLNAVFDHGCRVYHDANQSIDHATVTALAFNSERYDTDAYHDPSTNNSRVTITSGQDGKYLITANVRFNTNATGQRQVRIRLNGTTVIAQHENDAKSSGTTTIALSTVYDLSATDYLEVLVYQDSGGALDVLSSANFSPEFMVQRLA